MNFLHITLGVPQLRTGGLITYAYAVAETESKMGHTVTILYPGNYTLTKKKSHIRKYYAQGKFSIYKVINPSFVAIPFGVKSPARITKPGNRKMYTDFLDDIKPDIVHVHTFMGFSRELFEEIKKRNIPIVYTTHDYYPICPKTSRVNVNNEICNGSAPEKCALCNANASESMILQYILQSEWYPKIKRSKLLMKLKQKRNKFIQNGSEIKEVNKAENNVFISKNKVFQYKQLLNYMQDIFDMIDIVHCNSSVTEQIFGEYIKNKKHFILNITTEGIVDLRGVKKEFPFESTGIINIGYIGIRDFHKGSWLLYNAGKVLYKKGYKFKMSFYGDEFNINKEEYPFCKENGNFNHNKLPEVMAELDLLIVPGYWYETFGFSTIEAIANNVPVLVSEHTGSKDLLIEMTTPRFFEPNVLELSKLLEKYIQNPELLKKACKEQNNIHLVCTMREHVKLLLHALSI